MSLAPFLFGRGKRVEQAVKGLESGRRLYAVGDIHGRLDLTQAVIARILADLRDYEGQATVVFLGDYVDRGPQSKQVVDFFLSKPLGAVETVYLQGNHEQTLLQFLYGADVGNALDWFRFGGLATLQSYGVSIKGIPTAKDVEAIRKDFAEKCPYEHKLFYQSLSLSYSAAQYFFVHAGIKPKRPLDKQTEADMLWIRDEFINSERDHGKIIVHGHTVTETAVFKPNRIGLDTGAYSTGNLSCACFENVSYRLV